MWGAAIYVCKNVIATLVQVFRIKNGFFYELRHFIKHFYIRICLRFYFVVITIIVLFHVYTAQSRAKH